jgi:hypothetical protein
MTPLRITGLAVVASTRLASPTRILAAGGTVI